MKHSQFPVPGSLLTSSTRTGGRPALLPLLFLLAGGLPAQSPEEYHRRADLALQTFLLRFWDADDNYLRANRPDDGRLTGYWTFAQGFDAVLDGVERTGGGDYLGFVETFYRSQNSRGWFASHYDDESWMALALLRAHDGIPLPRRSPDALLREDRGHQRRRHP